MIFLRARVHDEEPIGGGNLVLTLPGSVRTGDYCVLWIASSTTTATLNFNGTGGWLTLVDSITNSSANKLFRYAGFVPSSPGANITITMSDTTKAYCASMSFWGGVNTTKPYSAASLDNSGTSVASFTKTVTFSKATDLYNGSAGALAGKVPTTGGGTWGTTATPYETDDFALDGVGNCDRTAVSDAATDIRYGRIMFPSSTAAMVNTAMWKAFSLPEPGPTGFVCEGFAMRITNKDTFLATVLRAERVAGQTQFKLEIWMANSGAPSLIGSSATFGLPWTSGIDAEMTASVDTTGKVDFVLKDTLYGTAVTATATNAALATSGALQSGSAGILDWCPAASANKRTSKSITINGSEHAAPVVILTCGMVPNADTFSMTSTPNSPAAVSEVITSGWTTLAERSVGRALGVRYTTMPALTDYSITLTDNLEVGTANTDFLTIGAMVLNPSDMTPVGSSSVVLSPRKQRKGTAGWQFFAYDLSGGGGNGGYGADARLGQLDAKDRSITWTHNRPGSASCSIALTDDIASKLEVASCGVRVYLDGQCVWGGPIWSIAEDAASNKMTIGAVGWLQPLERRLIAVSQERDARFGAIDAGCIAAHLHMFANEQTMLSTHIGSVVATQSRKRTYQRFQNIGAEIVALSDIESGYDLWVDPLTREISIWGSFVEDRKSSVSFGYNAGPVHNLSNISRQRAADKLVNGIYTITKNASTSPPRQDDTASITAYGLHEEQISLGDVTDPNVALAYAAGELVYRANPLNLYTLTPAIETPDTPNVPKPISDYHIGSLIKFSAKKGSIQVSKQTARVFSFTVSLSDDGVERVSSIGVTAS